MKKEFFLDAILFLTIAFLLFFAVATLLFGCVKRPRCETPDAMRCYDNMVQQCTQDGYWFPVDDCDEIYLMDGGVDAWQCRENGTEAGCWEDNR